MKIPMNDIQNWLIEDEKTFKCKPICQEIFNFHDEFACYEFLKSQFHSNIIEKLKFTAKHILEQDVPNYIPRIFELEHVSRCSGDGEHQEGLNQYVVVRIYVVPKN